MSHPVLAAVLERASRHSTPHHRSDPYRIALAVEGGAMRGVVSAGMLAKLEALGLRDTFDAVYGSSAGALNAATFLAGQASLGVSRYQQQFSDRSFIDIRGLLRGNPAVDLDAVFGDIGSGRFPLAFPEIQRSGINLVVLASQVMGNGGANAHPETRLRRLTDFGDLHDLVHALHAGARLPILAGGPVAYRGMQLLDGGILADIPVYAAIADGYDRILALVTLPEGARRSRLASLFESAYITPRLEAVDPVLAAAFASRHVRYKATLAFLRSRRDNQQGPPFVTFVTLPRGAPKISAFETRPTMLMLGATAGGCAIYEALNRQSV